jgi:hypothetical protein
MADDEYWAQPKLFALRGSAYISIVALRLHTVLQADHSEQWHSQKETARLPSAVTQEGFQLTHSRIPLRDPSEEKAVAALTEKDQSDSQKGITQSPSGVPLLYKPKLIIGPPNLYTCTPVFCSLGQGEI